MVLRWVACAWDYAMHALHAGMRARACVVRQDVCMVYCCSMWYAGYGVLVMVASSRWLVMVRVAVCLFWC